MQVMVPIALFGWIPAVLLMFALLGPKRAVVPAFVLAWLFLPMSEYKIQGIPAYSKVTATSIGVLLGAMIFDANRLLSFRPKLLDIPMAVWCLTPFVSSILNDLGAYDGASAVFYNTAMWGIPYFIARCYITELEDVQRLATWIFIGGILYAPLCLFENRMAPQLNSWIYGFSQLIILRYYGQFSALGWQPVVFMQNSLAVTMFMVSAAICGIWLWNCGTLRRIFDLPMAWVAPVVLLSAILCKSLGPIGLMIAGLAALYSVKWLNIRLAVLLLALVPIFYMYARTSESLTRKTLLTTMGDYVSAERFSSAKTRFDNEDLLTEKALQRPWFGWARWARSHVFDAEGKDISITDGLWVIAIGETGLVGLTALTLSFLLPPILLWKRLPTQQWYRPETAGLAVLGILAIMHMGDNLFNAMINPLYVLAVGAINNMLTLMKQAKRAQQEYQPEYIDEPAYLQQVGS